MKIFSSRGCAGWLCFCLAALIFFPSTIQAGTNAFLLSSSTNLSQEEPAILVETKTSTWMPRGRNLQDAGPLVREKLSRAGFLIKTEQGDPPILSLRVNYQETRGLQYTLDSFGTKITCAVELIHPFVARSGRSLSRNRQVSTRMEHHLILSPFRSFKQIRTSTFWVTLLKDEHKRALICLNRLSKGSGESWMRNKERLILFKIHIQWRKQSQVTPSKLKPGRCEN